MFRRQDYDANWDLHPTTMKLTLSILICAAGAFVGCSSIDPLEPSQPEITVSALPDPCLAGTAQPGVSDRWWFMVSLSGAEHVLHVTGVDPEKESFDSTYKLSVAP